MNHRRKLIAVLISAACACATATAGTTNNPREIKDPVCGEFMMPFVNGINNTPEEAAISRNNLAAAYGNTYLGHLIKYVLAYNQTNGVPADFYASLRKVIASKAGATWENYYNAVQSSIFASGMTPALAASISTTVDNLFGLIKPAPYADADFAAIYNAIMAQWTAGMRMVVVTHSEGNLFAPGLYKKLIEGGVPSTAMGFVGVANPDDTSPVVSFTSTNDLVIDSIRRAVANVPGLAQPLAANITIPYNFAADPLGHSMETYLGDPAAKLKIITAMYNKMNTLKTTTKLGSANTGSSRFFGMAAWSDCTGTPYYGDMDKWPNVWPAGRSFQSCGSGPAGYFTPMVFYRVAGQTAQIVRAGQSSEVPGLAATQRDSCIAQAKSFYQTWVATGAVDGTLINCGSTVGASSYKIELATRYRAFMSGDDGGLKSWTEVSIGYYLEGATDAFTGPTCRN